MKVYVYSVKEFEIPYLEKMNSQKHELTFSKDPLSLETAIKATGYDAISIFSADDASAAVIEKLKKVGVQYITLRSTGYDNVDLLKATKLGISVVNVPAYSPYSIAEHATGLLLALNRKLITFNQRVSAYNFDLSNLIGFDLHMKTVGIIGTGNIGAIMTKIMHGFGCTILGYDIKQNNDLIDQYGLTYDTLREVCRKADIISLHVPLNSQTHYLINKEVIKEMKKGVIIINTARGGVLHTKDVIAGLESGKIGALGMDVYENEKGLFFKDHAGKVPDDALFMKLKNFPNVLITGHHAFLTNEALTNIAETTINNLDFWDNGQGTIHELTEINKQSS